MIKIKRVYDKSPRNSGKHILIDHVRPGGLKKEDAPIDELKKEITPMDQLREWLNPGFKQNEFKKKLFTEQQERQKTVDAIISSARKSAVTLLLDGGALQ